MWRNATAMELSLGVYWLSSLAVSVGSQQPATWPGGTVAVLEP